jgi:hypothetical protein
MGGRKPAHRDGRGETNSTVIKEYEVSEAEEFWEILSPQRYLFKVSPTHCGAVTFTKLPSTIPSCGKIKKA